MAKYLLLRGGLVLLKTSTYCGMPIFLKGNHRLESRMHEICLSGSEGGAKPTFVPTPIRSQARSAWNHQENNPVPAGRLNPSHRTQTFQQEYLAFVKRQEHSTRCRLLMPGRSFDDKYL